MAAGRIKGITIEIGGNTTGLDKSLKSVNGTIYDTKSQLKDVERLLKLDPKNTVLLAQKQKLLEQEVSATKEKLEGLKQANEQVSKTAKNYDAWKEKYEPIKTEIDETKTKLDELKKRSAEAEKELASGKISQEKYDALQSEIAETEDKLKSLKKDAKAVDDEFGKPISPKQYDALQREIIETENKLKSLEGGAGKTKTALEKVSGALGSAGGKLDSAANEVMPVSVAVGGIATAGLKVAADFESGMSQVQAITGATGDEFDALREKAVDLGASTAFSSNEVATAMAEMGKAGWDTQQIMDGMEGVLAAAAASGEGLSSVSTIVADAITGFKLEASDATKVADLLTQAANSGTIDINDLGESFKYVAPVASAAGWSIEDCTTALAAMSQSGIKGSQAGTSLRAMFSKMTKASKPAKEAMDEYGISLYDSSGKVKPLDDVIANLRETLGTTTVETQNADGTMKEYEDIMSQVEDGTVSLTDKTRLQALAQIFGQEALSGVLAVINKSPEEYDKLASSMDNSAGVAKKTASVMQDNLKSKIEQLGGALESLAIKLSETVIPWLTDFVENLTGMIDKFTEMPKGAQKMITALGGIVIAAGPTTKALVGVFNTLGTVSGGLAKFGGMLTESAQKAGNGASAIGTLCTALSGPWGVVAAAGAAATGLLALTIATSDVINKTDENVEATNKLAEEQDALTDAFNANREAREESLRAAETEAEQADFYMDKLEDLIGAEEKSSSQKEKIKFYVDKLNGVLPDLNLNYDEEKDSLNQSTEAIRNNIAAQKDLLKAKAGKEQLGKITGDIMEQEMKLDELTKQKIQNEEDYKKAQEETAKFREKLDNSGHERTQVEQDAYTSLLDNEKRKKKALDESNGKLKEANDELKRLNGEYAKTEQYVTDHFDSAELEKSLNALAEKAKKKGIEIPEAVKQGILEGKYALPETVDGLQNLISFDAAVQKAGLSGVQIPHVLAAKISSGEISVSDAIAAVNNLADFDKAVQSAADAGTKIPGTLRRQIATGKITVAEAVQRVNDIVKFDAAAEKAGVSGTKVARNYRDSIAKGKTSVAEAVKGLKAAAEKNAKPNLNGSAKKSADEYANGLSSAKGKADKAAETMVGGIAKVASRKFGAAKDSAKKEASAAAKAVESSTNKMERSFSGMKLNFPAVSLPRLPKIKLNTATKVVDGKSITYPSGFSWYKKGGIFNNPSIIGVGEAGPEAVLPIEKLNVMFDRMADSIISGVGTLMRANSGGPSGDVHLDVYLYPNGPKYGEEIVKTYDTYKRRLG